MILIVITCLLATYAAWYAMTYKKVVDWTLLSGVYPVVFDHSVVSPAGFDGWSTTSDGMFCFTINGGPTGIRGMHSVCARHVEAYQDIFGNNHITWEPK